MVSEHAVCIWLFFIILLRGVRMSPLHTAATPLGLLCQSQIIDDEYWAVSGMKIGRGDRSTRRKPAPVPFCSPQIPHDLTRFVAMWSQRLTARAVARPSVLSMALQLFWLYPLNKIWGLRNHELQMVTHWLVQLSLLYNISTDRIENFLSHSSSIVVYWLSNNSPVATCWFVAAARCFGCRCPTMAVSFNFHVTIYIVPCNDVYCSRVACKSRYVHNSEAYASKLLMRDGLKTLRRC
jgi:hypothetical protein